MLNPKFFTDRRVLSLEPLERLLFQALWCDSDCTGYLVDEPFEIKIRYMPADTIDVEVSLSRMASLGLIDRHEKLGRRVIRVVNFSKHQKPHPKEQPSEIIHGKPGKIPASKKQVLASPALSSSSSSSSSPSFPSESESVNEPAEPVEDAAADVSKTLVPLKPKPDDPFASGEAFFCDLQHARTGLGLLGEKPPRTISTWWSEVLMELNGDPLPLRPAVIEFYHDSFWAKAKPPFPFPAFMKEWRKYVDARAN
jgi:hypothetical protein